MRNSIKQMRMTTFFLVAAFSVFSQTGFAQQSKSSKGGDETELYSQVTGKIAKTNASFAEKQKNFEQVRQKQTQSAQPDKPTVCASFAEWYVIFQDQVANRDELLGYSLDNRFKAHKEQVIQTVQSSLGDLTSEQIVFDKIAAEYGCQLSARKSDGSSNASARYDPFINFSFPEPKNQTTADQTPVKTPQATPTPAKADEPFKNLFDDFDYSGKTPASDNGKAKTDEAVNAFNDFISQFDVEDAEDLIAQGYYNTARQKMDAIIKADPKNADAFTQRAIAIYEKHQAENNDDEHDTAVSDAETAIELNPNNAPAHWILGKLYGDDLLLTGEDADEENKTALELVGKVIARYPNNAESYYIRGLITQFSGGDIADLTKAVQIDPKLSRAYYQRAISFYGGSNYYQALADFNKVIELSPKSINAYYYRGATYRRLGELDKAVSDIRRAVELDPANQNLKNLLKEYGNPASEQEIIARYKFFKSELDKSTAAYNLQVKKYDEATKTQTQNPVICQALTELKNGFQNLKAASDKLVFVNNYPQIAGLQNAIADNKSIADFDQKAPAVFAQEAAKHQCK